MSRAQSVGAGNSQVRDRLLPFLLLLFVGSGAAALIYEIVWFQMLELFVGSSAVSLGVLLGTFMGGMCLGSLLLPRAISPEHHPLRVYALLEFGIGALGLVLLVVMPLVGRVYVSWGGYGLTGYLLRGLVASLCLLPPTLAMGATLPAVARWLETTPRGVSWLGFFYAGNIAGAVFGSLLAGFYLLRVYDMATATFVAVGFNVAVAAIAVRVASGTPATAARPLPHATDPGVGTPGSSGEPKPSLAAAPAGEPAVARIMVYVAIALSGFCALAAEVIWTRMLGLLFGATTYTFSIILAVFLIGLGGGSSLGSIMARSLAKPRVALAACQLLNVGAMAWTAHMLTRSLPYWPINSSISTDIWFNFQLDFARALWAVLPAPILWGASFPLALAAVTQQGRDLGRLVGGVYAANTLGAILGSLGASLLLVYWIGSQHAQQIMMIVSVLAGLLLLTPVEGGSQPSRKTLPWVPLTALVTAVAGAALLIRSVPPIPGILVAYGRYAATWVGQTGDILYVGEGLNSSVAVSLTPSGVLNYHNAGKVQASSLPQDMRLQRLLGHFTTLTPNDPKSILVIGCGAGVTAGAVSVDPRVERVTIAEIEPLVPRVVSNFFGEHNFNVLENPKVKITIDDARHYLLTTDEKFDAITSDPFDPWVKGTATLYTREFFELIKQHLNPGGAVTLFVQLYESSAEAVKSEIGTFFEVFPEGVIWGNTSEGKGYDMVLLGMVEPLHFDVEQMEARLTHPDYAVVKRSLGEIGINSAIDLFANYAGRASELQEYLADAPINRDRDLRLQYLAGLGLNLYRSGEIYSEIMRYQRFPEGLFSGPETMLQQLRQAIAAGPGRVP